LRSLFPYLPQQPGYNKRLRALAGTVGWLIGMLARDTSLCSDDVWLADSTPVECGRSRETSKRSALAGFAEYDYCASHSRYFWGLRLHLLCTVHGLPIGFALTGAKADERATLLDILTDPTLPARGRDFQIGTVAHDDRETVPSGWDQCHRRQLMDPGWEPAVTSPFHPAKASRTSPFSRSGTLK
jgi:hypothetical protein